MDRVLAFLADFEGDLQRFIAAGRAAGVFDWDGWRAGVFQRLLAAYPDADQLVLEAYLHQSESHVRQELERWIGQRQVPGALAKISESIVTTIRDGAAAGFGQQVPHAIHSQLYLVSVLGGLLEAQLRDLVALLLELPAYRPVQVSGWGGWHGVACTVLAELLPLLGEGQADQLLADRIAACGAPRPGLVGDGGAGAGLAGV